MKEITQIIASYQNCKESGKQTALATVVKVDGSAYRRPSARMLVTEDGELTGAISGGCLEGDALRKAQSVIFQQRSMIVTYDTTDEDDQKFGVGLGCNGIIQVLIEPVDYSSATNPVELLKIAIRDRNLKILITVFSLKNARAEQIGTQLLFDQESSVGNKKNIPDKILNHILDNNNYIFENQSNKILDFDEHFIFFECIKAPIHLLLFGAGNDTVPLSKIADILGWELTLIDGRSSYASQSRFPTAKKIIVTTADEAVSKLTFDSQTVALLMTHNFEYEVMVLKGLLEKTIPYIGILGPKKKRLKLMERLVNEGVVPNQQHIYGPMGLDIGAEGSEEIALSVFAEIKAVLSQKSSGFLRDKDGPIHEEER
ncbi:MAG: XdhC/CoxI family protein [Mongoliibacter sp.]|uniref:XdhC family protein n=1 Tax=Mongoliibacter sp. TaxID=2022438 RepID=UPI0012F35D7E|nr:XdhC/CoxI family protein [Mongoliibacter sp.]TVP50178.1 MAG: XdhC/CoxI family protein [Mongoliibacter sp.]